MESGRIIGGKYRIRRLIGEGGMGAVWSAVHEALDRTVAIKFLHPGSADADTASARFVSEAKCAARVKHRSVVDVFDFGITEDGVYYMVQELLEGEDLADCLTQGPAWEVRDVVLFAIQCLSGLEAVHQAGIVHRDLKPENIFVMRDSDGRYPKLLDFGISKIAERPGKHASWRPPARGGARPQQLTTKGTTVGTPWYMSPEQLRGKRDLDGRADLYSMGVILYEWLSGRVPYQQENVAELSLQIASGSATPLITFRPDLGHALSSLVARALSPEPDERFQSAAAMRDALTEVLPTIGNGFSVVQRGDKSAPMGQPTELFLRSAASPFADDDSLPGTLAHRARRTWLWAIGALLLVGISLVPFLWKSNSPRAGADAAARSSGSPSGHTATQGGDGRPRVHTTTAVAPAEPSPDEPGPAQPPDVRPLAQDAGTGRTAKRNDKASASRPPPSRRSAPKRSDRKVIRTLDF